MSKHDWGNGAALGLVAGISLTINVLVWLSVGWDWIDSEITSADPSAYATDQCAKQQAAHAASNISILNSNKTGAAEISTQGTDNEQENEPGWCDLAAQQSTAYSTVGMKKAAWLTAVLTTGGVFLLWLTLVYTRRTLNEAKDATVAAQNTVNVTREIGEAQVMAHLMPVDLSVRLIKSYSDQRKTAYFSAKFKIKNVGSTPAYRVSVSSVVDGFDKNEWANANPSDIGPHDEALIKFRSGIDPRTLGDERFNYRMNVYIRFDTIFTRASDSPKRNSVRFDYEITRNSNGTHDAKRL